MTDHEKHIYPTNTIHSANVGLMLGHCRRRCASIKPTLVQCIVLAGEYDQQCESTLNISFSCSERLLVNKLEGIFNNSFLRLTKWNESGFRPPLCTYRLNWARRASWGWWDDWDDTVLQTQDSKFKPWRSEAEHATSQYWLSHVDGEETFFVSFNRRDREPNPELWRERQRC